MEGNVDMLWMGLVVISILIIASLCKIASVADRRSNNIYQKTHRGDDDGNNQNL